MELTLRHKDSGREFKIEVSPESRRRYAVKSALKGLFLWSDMLAKESGRQQYVRLMTLTVADGFEYSPRCLDSFMSDLRAYFKKIGVRWGYVSVVKVQEERAKKAGKDYPHWHIAITCPYKAFPNYDLLRSWWKYGTFIHVTKARPVTDKNCYKLTRYCLDNYMGSDRERFFEGAGRVWSRTLFSVYFTLPLWATMGVISLASSLSISYQTLLETYWLRRIGSRVQVGAFHKNEVIIGGVRSSRRSFVPLFTIRSPWRSLFFSSFSDRHSEAVRTWPLVPQYSDEVPF